MEVLCVYGQMSLIALYIAVIELNTAYHSGTICHGCTTGWPSTWPAPASHARTRSTFGSLMLQFPDASLCQLFHLLSGVFQGRVNPFPLHRQEMISSGKHSHLLPPSHFHITDHWIDPPWRESSLFSVQPTSEISALVPGALYLRAFQSF